MTIRDSLLLWGLLLFICTGTLLSSGFNFSKTENLTSQVLNSSENLLFDGNKSFQHLKSQMDFGPRPPGTENLLKTAAYINQTLLDFGWFTKFHDFTPSVLWDGKNVTLHNVIGEKPKISSQNGDWIIFGAHYDTRIIADRDPDPGKRTSPVPGANDGASGVAVLLELARVFSSRNITGVRFLFFDGEDQGRDYLGGNPGWDWILGSKGYVETLDHPESIRCVIVVDMVGDENQNIEREPSGSDFLTDEIWSVASELGYGNRFRNSIGPRILDDHQPFLEKGIPAVDIIDIDYPYWHTTEDNISHVSANSLEAVGRTLEAWMINLENNTSQFQKSSFKFSIPYWTTPSAFLLFSVVTLFRKRRSPS